MTILLHSIIMNHGGIIINILNTHYARLSLALSSGRQVNDILIIEPTTSSWLYDSYTKPNKKSEEIGQAFQTFITALEKSQVEYDLGSENIIKDMGSVARRKAAGRRSRIFKGSYPSNDRES